MANSKSAVPVTDEPQAARRNGRAAETEATPPAERIVDDIDATPEQVTEARADTGKRRMPDNLRRFLLRLQGGKMYLPAAYRIVWFRDECPDWGIETILLEGGQEAGFATVQAKVYNSEGRLIASGMKTETKQDFPAGWVEKAESGAISRALAVTGFGTQFMPELDDDGSRLADSPIDPQRGIASGRAASDGPRGADGAAARTAAAPNAAVSASAVWEGPGQCPTCHAPEGRRHAKPCIA